MKRVILLSQLICMSMLFAPRDSRERPSIASTESLPSLSRSALSSPSREAPSSPSRDVLSLSTLDCAMFKHWYGDCFKTKEIDGVSYFIELPERETKSPFVLMGMSSYTQVSSLSVSVVENNFSSKHASIFNTSNERPIRFKYTINQKVQFGEAKDIFNTIVPKAKQMMQDMLDELNDAYRYGYKSHLPLDSIEVQDESGTIYLICGIEQSSAKNYWISESESIRIRIKASKQCPESFRMSKKHLLAPLLTSCPEFYMSRRYLGMYHAIYSALNTELVESLKGISKFPKVERYSQIPDSLREREWFNKAQETIEYLQENELEPFIYIPTYQHDMLAEGIPTYQHDMLAKSMDKDEDYGSLIFTFSNYNRNYLPEFKTEVVNDSQYTLYFEPDEMKKMKKAGLGDTFRLSDLIGKEINLYALYVSLFCPAPGKFKQSSGNTEFRYRYSLEYDESGSIDAFKNAESLADAFKNALQEAKTVRDKIIGKLSEIKSVDFPLALVGEWPGYHDDPEAVFKFIGSEGARLGYSLGFGDIGDNEPCSFEEFLTEEHLIAYRDVCNLVGRGVRELLSGVTEFNNEQGYRDVPELLKIQSFWYKVEEVVKKSFLSKLEFKTDGDFDFTSHEYLVIQIPRYQYDALIDKQHELLSFTRDKGNVFKTADTDSRIYSLTLSSASGLGDTCKLSDLRRKKITNLSVHDDYNKGKYNINKLMSGDEVSEQFKIGSQMIRKLENARLGEATVNVDERVKIECRGDIEIPDKYACDGYKLKIRETDHTILRKFLTEDRLKACKDLCKLIERSLSKLLSDSYVEKDDEKDYVYVYVYVPKLLTVKPFWPKAQALLNQIGVDVSISIPRWIHNKLTDSLPEACDASSNIDDDETSKDCEEGGYGNEF